MQTRKEMKRRARQTVRGHWGILVAVCLIAAFLGTEFSNSLSLIYHYRGGVAAESEATEYSGMTTGVYRAIMTDALATALSGDVEEGKKISRERTDEAVQRTRDGEGNPALGRSRGFAARIVNGVASGSFLVEAVAAFRGIGASTNVVLVLFILLALGLGFLVWFYLVNMYTAVSRRIFLESRMYEKVPIQRFLVFIRIRRWHNVSKVMFMTSVFYFLWSLTIVGQVIKKYSYYMVPYIVAENPDISWREAITLSRKMMNGHKWECFVFELSFLPWELLGNLTLGIIRILYVNPYEVAAFTEYYANLREIAKQNNLEGSQLLNDQYLFEKADHQTLEKAYEDVVALSRIPEVKLPLRGIRSFMARAFGITIFNRTDEEQYMASEERKLRVLVMENIVAGKSYPGRLFPIPESQKNRMVENIHYLRHYSIPTLVFLFFIFSFIGWIWEVSLHLVLDGAFVNRGVLRGPWLPIYGAGGVLILMLLNKLRRRPVLEFLAILVLCGFVEYVTSYVLEVTQNGTKWWDYSGYFLNLNGRICAEALLIFGLGGIAIVYLAAPLLDNYLRRIPFRISVPVCAVLLAIFLVDSVYSLQNPNTGKGITDYHGAAVEQREVMEHDRGFSGSALYHTVYLSGLASDPMDAKLS